MDRGKGFRRNGEDEQLEDFLEWLEGQGSAISATRVLSEVSGIDLDRRALARIKKGNRWDRGGKFRQAWLAHPDSGPAEPATALDDAGDTPAAAHEALDGERSRNGVAQPDAASGDAMQEGGDTADDADGLLPKGMLLEEMIDVIDARRDGSSGGESETDGEEPENAEWERQRVLQAGTVEEIAAAADAPVLAEVPGLDLEDARAAALLKLGGWTPADRERRPPGLLR